MNFYGPEKCRTRERTRTESCGLRPFLGLLQSTADAAAHQWLRAARFVARLLFVLRHPLWKYPRT